jgi:hypothetical protein
MILFILFLDDFTAAALALSTRGTGLTAVKNALFFIASADNSATAGRANLFCHLGTSSGYLLRLYALCWRRVSDFCLI